MECSPTTLQEMSFGIYKKIGTYLTDWFALNPSHLNQIVLSIPFLTFWIYWQDPHCGMWRSGGAYLLALWNYDGTWTYSHSCALQFVSKCIRWCSLRLEGKFNVEVCVSQVRTSDGVLSHYTTGDVISNLQEDWHLLDWLVCIESITFESDSFVNSFFDFLNLLAGPSLRHVTIRRGLFTCTLKLRWNMNLLSVLCTAICFKMHSLMLSEARRKV